MPVLPFIIFSALPQLLHEIHFKFSCFDANPRVRQLVFFFVFWPHTSRVLRAHVCSSSKIPLLGMFVWNENVCQTPWSSHLSVGGRGYPACLGDASWRVRVVDRGDVLSV